MSQKVEQSPTELPLANLPSPAVDGVSPPEYSAGPGSPGALQTPTPAVTAQPKATAPPTATPGQIIITPLNQIGERTEWIQCPFCLQTSKIQVRKEGSTMQVYVSSPHRGISDNYPPCFADTIYLLTGLREFSAVCSASALPASHASPIGLKTPSTVALLVIRSWQLKTMMGYTRHMDLAGLCKG